MVSEVNKEGDTGRVVAGKVGDIGGVEWWGAK